ncbi:MAG: hypothetical protein AAB964_02730 [Patescibacteria group bacterium]
MSLGDDLKRCLDTVVEKVARDNNTTQEEVLRRARELLNETGEPEQDELLKQLSYIGITPMEMDRYWIDAILCYRKEGRCGSVNYSTAQFIPILSRCLAALKPRNAS